MNPFTTRCLAHGCNTPDQCRRHTAIREHQPIDDDVVENACRIGLPMVPIDHPPLTAATTTPAAPSFSHDDAWRDAIAGK